MVQQYAMLFHRRYCVVKANQFGTEQHRPLLVIPAHKNLINTPFVTINNPKVVLSMLKRSEDKKGIVLRLRSFSEREEFVKLVWADKQPVKVQKCTAEERPLETVGNQITISPYGTESFYLTF
jgi:alpha-mannosidase